MCHKSSELFWGKKNFVLLTFVIVPVFGAKKDSESFQVISDLETGFLKKMVT